MAVFDMPDHLYALLVTSLGIASLLLNLMLIFLICSRDAKEIENYKWCIMHLTVSNLLFSTIFSFLLQPRPLLPAMSAVVVGPLRHLGEYWGGYIPFFLCAALLCYNVQSVTLCFFFRYVEVVRHSLYERFTSRGAQITVLTGAIIVFFFEFWALHHSRVSKEAIAEQIGEYCPEIFDPLAFVNSFVVFGFNPKYNQWITASYIVLGGGIIYLNIVNGCCAWRILVTLNAHDNPISYGQRQIQVKMLKALGMQAILPVMLIAVPMMVMNIAMHEHLRIAYFNEAFLTCVLTHSILNPIINMYYIDVYRQSVTRRLSRYRTSRIVSVVPMAELSDKKLSSSSGAFSTDRPLQPTNCERKENC